MSGPTRSCDGGRLTVARKSRFRRRLDRWLYYPLQTAAMFLFYAVFRLLPVDAASAVGGWVGRTVGPWMTAANRRAMYNLAMAMPELSEAQRRQILRGMWDNIGRTLGELPHLQRLREADRLEVVDVENVNGAAVADRPKILVGGHVGNWELQGAWVAKNVGRLSIIYRAPNNPGADWLIGRIRTAAGLVLCHKGNEGAKAAMKALAQGDSLGMLLDQKLNTGVAVPFFGHDAMTTSAPALFALRFGCAVVPARVERLGGARFRLTFYPPLEFDSTGDRNADVETIMSRVNEILEGWVRDRPEQWIWMHRRWVDSVK